MQLTECTYSSIAGSENKSEGRKDVAKVKIEAEKTIVTSRADNQEEGNQLRFLSVKGYQEITD
jgi:hypothetical protein